MRATELRAAARTQESSDFLAFFSTCSHKTIILAYKLMRAQYVLSPMKSAMQYAADLWPNFHFIGR